MNKSDEPIVLRIYQARSGKWAGRLMLVSEKLADIARFACPRKIRRQRNKTGPLPKHLILFAAQRLTLHHRCPAGLVECCLNDEAASVAFLWFDGSRPRIPSHCQSTAKLQYGSFITSRSVLLNFRNVCALRQTDPPS